MKPVRSTKKQSQNSFGGWKPKVTRSDILICVSCKDKYIKTRARQIVCIKCLRVPVESIVFHLSKKK